MNVYKDNGYDSRKEYLECLAEDFETSLETVINLALLLGKEEDFDGLVSALESVDND